MSASVEEISHVGASDHHGCECADGDDDEDDDIGSSAHATKDAKKRTSYGFGIGREFGKAKQVVLHQYTKAKKRLHQVRRSKRASRSSSSTVNASRTSGKTILEDGSGVGRGCYFCLSRPQVLESPSSSEINDPNDPNFTYGMLKTLIETNDFYSKECNTHID